jgi:hypothetical protein
LGERAGLQSQPVTVRAPSPLFERIASPSREGSTAEPDAVHCELRQALNADRRRRFGSSGRLLALVCECGELSCHRTVLMTPEQYDAQQPGLILHPSHLPTAG